MFLNQYFTEKHSAISREMHMWVRSIRTCYLIQIFNLISNKRTCYYNRYDQKNFSKGNLFMQIIKITVFSHFKIISFKKKLKFYKKNYHYIVLKSFFPFFGMSSNLWLFLSPVLPADSLLSLSALLLACIKRVTLKLILNLRRL